MRACLALCVAAALVGAAQPECDACIEGRCYHKHRLPISVDSGWALDINRNTNILYVKDGNILKQCQIDAKQCNTTSHTLDIRSLNIDQRSGDTYGVIYDGSNHSLYKLDLVNEENKLLIRGVPDITFKDKLYYTNDGNSIYTLEDGESEETENVYNFVVDKVDDIYFRTLLDGELIIRRLSKGVVDKTVYWDMKHLLTADKDGNAVFVHEDSHAVYRAIDGQLTEIGFIDDSIYIYLWYDPPLFDRDNNIIYRNNSQDYFLLKRDTDVNNNCTFSISQNKTIIEMITSSTPDGDTEDNEDMSPSTPAAESAASTPGEGGASHSGTPGQQHHDTGHEQ